MTQKRRFLILLAIVMSSMVLLAACGGDDDEPAADSGTDATQDEPADTGEDAGGASADLEFTILGFAFPTGLKVPAGGTVAVTNGADVSHTVTSDDGAFDTDSISSGDTVTFTAPDEPGDYPFHCAIHSQMKGLLQVE